MECKQMVRRIAALLLCLMLALGSTTAAFADTLAYTKQKAPIYVEDNGKLVKAGTAPKGTEVNVQDTNGDWAKVEKDGKVAYMKRSVLTAQTQAPQTAAPQASDIVKCDKPVYAAVDGVTVYADSDIDSEELTTLSKGTMQRMVAYDDEWCMVKNGRFYGYVLRSEMSLEKVTAATPVPTVRPTEAPVDADDEVTLCNKSVYVAKDGAKVYASDNASASVKDTLTKGMKLTMTAYTDEWCLIRAGGKKGYMKRADLSLEKVAADPTEAPAEENDDVVQCNKSVYVANDGAKVYGSASTSASVKDTLTKGTKLTMTAYTDEWCLIKAGGRKGYMKRTDLSLEKVAADPTEAPTIAPTAKPESGAVACDKTAYAVKDGVKVYADADTGSNAIGTLNKNDAVRVTGYTDKWCRVKNGRYIGYIQRDQLSDTKAPELPDELKYGDSGDAVKLLQQRLKDLGYFNGAIGGNYLSQTREAVTIFQSQNDLTIDGTAGSKTLEVLFSDKAKKFDESKVEKEEPKVEDETGSSTASPASGKAIEMDWWTSGIQSIFSRGTTAVVTDVSTGISWKERRNGGTNHADVQPVTASDTAAMKRAVGSWSWERRAVWVSIGGKKYAASMNCMPHGSGSITDNNFNGHHCIHFTNSRTHGSNSVCPLHQAAIKKALAKG